MNVRIMRQEVFDGKEEVSTIQPGIPSILAYTGFLVVIAIVGHTVANVLAPKDADTPVDERERQIFNRAGHYSSYVIATGIVMPLGLYILSNSGDLLFYTVFAGLLVGQIMEYLIQILFYRTSV